MIKKVIVCNQQNQNCIKEILNWEDTHKMRICLLLCNNSEDNRQKKRPSFYKTASFYF
mgnify:CR=1|jgi:hypothetical protein